MGTLHAGDGQSEVVPADDTQAAAQAVAAALLAEASTPGDVLFEDGAFIVPASVASGATLPVGTFVSTPAATVAPG